ncbi:hypothetical protein, partial [Candidatus Deferrimicrobium sp.]|uniref:hypothetical protein n=1 Tax=Candidatus Deferrimicrobium sp. TaxID=3060586 RepID=UPI00271D6AFF
KAPIMPIRKETNPLNIKRNFFSTIPGWTAITIGVEIVFLIEPFIFLSAPSYFDRTAAGKKTMPVSAKPGLVAL